jgi:prepilin-type N-terminal cleavage/methylation domain-containing protein
MDRKAFTMVELIFVILIIGTLSAMAIPKFTGVKEQAVKATELSTASAVATALESIHSAWSISEDDFDWDNDGVDDDIDTELSSQGYPWRLSRDGTDALDALLKSGSNSGFVEQSDLLVQGTMAYRLYTGKATDPSRGLKYPTNASRDIAGKPDRNDFWLYAPEVNGTCYLSSDHFESKRVIGGDFILLDVNGTLPNDFDAVDLGQGFTVTCS